MVSISILKLCFQFMDLGPLANTSRRDVVDNFKVTSYNVVSRIIYERGTCTGAIRRLKFALTTVLPVLFKYCYKYCYSDSRKL